MKKRSITIMIILICLSFCSQGIKVKRFPNSITYSPTNPEKIRIFRNEPSRSYIELGEIVINHAPSLRKSEVNRILKTESAKMGGQAVIVIVDTIYRSKVVLKRRFYGRKVLRRRIYKDKSIVGITIRFKK